MEKRNHARSVTLGIATALLIALIVACVMTFMDWRLNPSGIFRGESGTHWARVAETATSWFLPTAAIACIVTVPVSLWLSFLARKHNDSM